MIGISKFIEDNRTTWYVTAPNGDHLYSNSIEVIHKWITRHHHAVLLIEEEYGYRDWIAILDKCEYDELIAKWATIRNLTCLVPVRWIVPQATVLEFDYNEESCWYQLPHKRCHIHEMDDSHLEGAVELGHEIEHYEPFYVNGKAYPLWGEDALSDQTLPY